MPKIVPLKLHADSDGKLQEISSTERNYLSYLAGLHIAEADSDEVGNLVLASAGNRLVGSFVDTYYGQTTGTHPASAISTTTVTTNIHQVNGTATEDGSNFRKPIAYHTDDNIYEMNDTNFDTLVDQVNSRIATSDYPGVYKLATTAPSADYIPQIPNVFSDTYNGSSLNTYSIYKRITMTAPSSTKILAVKRSLGRTGVYEGVQVLSDALTKHTIGQRAKSRRAIDGNIGSYELRSSGQGSPTSGGTWKAMGTASNTIRTLSETDYTRNRVCTLDPVRYSTYSRISARTSTRDFAGEYAGNYARDFSGNYSRDFVGVYTGDFTGDYSRIRASSYSRIRTSSFVGEYAGNYARNFAGNYARTFIGEYTRISVRDSMRDGIVVSTRISTRDFSRTRSSNYARGFAGNYSRDFAGNYAGNFVGEYSRDRNSGYARNFTRNRITDSAVTYVGDYIGNFIGNYARTFVGDYTRTRDSSYTRTRASTYSGNYTGNYTRTRSSGYARNYTRTRIARRDSVGTPDFTRTIDGIGGDPTQGYTRTSTRDFTRDRSASFISLRASTYSSLSYYSRSVSFTGAESSYSILNSGNNGGWISSYPNPTSWTTYAWRYTTYNYGQSSMYMKLDVYYSLNGSPQTVKFTKTWGSIVSEDIVDYREMAFQEINRVTVGSNTFVRGAYRGGVDWDANPPTTGDTVVEYFYIQGRGADKNYTRNIARASVTGTAGTTISTAQFVGNYTGNYSKHSTYVNVVNREPSSGYLYQTNYYSWKITQNPNNSQAVLTVHFAGATVKNTTYANFATADAITGFAAGGLWYYRGLSQPGYSYTTLWSLFRQSQTSRTGTADFTRIVTTPTGGEYINQGSVTTDPDDRRGTNTVGYARNWQQAFIGATSYMRFNGGPQYYTPSFIRYGQAYYSRIEGVAIASYINVDTSEYSRNFTSATYINYAGNYSRNYTGNYVPTYTGNYVGDFTGNYIGNYSRDFSRDFSRTRIISRLTNRHSAFAGNYSRDFAGEYTRDRESTYTRDTEIGYTRDRASAFTGNYTGNYSRDFSRTFVGDYTRTETRTSIRARVSSYNRTRPSNYARGFSALRTSAYTGNYAGNFVGNYIGNFAGEYSRDRESTYNRTRESTYTRISSRSRESTYAGNYSRDFSGQYTRNSVRDFSRTRSSAYTRDRASTFTRISSRIRVSNYAGNYTGEYTRGFVGNYSRTYVGNYVGTTIASGTNTVETYTLYVRIA